MNKDNLNIYYRNLMIKYINSLGKEDVNINSIQFLNNFSKWLKKSLIIKQKYLEFLDLVGINIDSSDFMEIGTTINDSIVDIDNMDTMILSSYAKSFDKNNEHNQVVEGDFIIVNNKPCVKTKTTDGYQNLCIPSNVISTFMMNNITSLEEIKDWNNLHNSGNFNILVGAYGKTTDKDKITKIKELQKLKEQLNEDAFDYFMECGDMYFAVVGSNKIRKNKKTR